MTYWQRSIPPRCCNNSRLPYEHLACYIGWCNTPGIPVANSCLHSHNYDNTSSMGDAIGFCRTCDTISRGNLDGYAETGVSAKMLVKWYLIRNGLKWKRRWIKTLVCQWNHQSQSLAWYHWHKAVFLWLYFYTKLDSFTRMSVKSTKMDVDWLNNMWEGCWLAEQHVRRMVIDWRTHNKDVHWLKTCKKNIDWLMTNMQWLHKMKLHQAMLFCHNFGWYAMPSWRLCHNADGLWTNLRDRAANGSDGDSVSLADRVLTTLPELHLGQLCLQSAGTVL